MACRITAMNLRSITERRHSPRVGPLQGGRRARRAPAVKINRSGPRLETLIWVDSGAWTGLSL